MIADRISLTVFAAVYAAGVLHFVWPWGWSGRRGEITLKRSRRPWEQ